MKKHYVIVSALCLVVIVSIFIVRNTNQQSSTEKLREQYQSYLENSPFKETKTLSRTERKALGLPPNAYNERMWELTMDPSTGRPMPERLFEIQQELKLQARSANAKGVAGKVGNPWVDRGPNNVGGRTRGIMFDPNDVGNANPNDDYTRVFAGGVSGGLWVNEDITNANSSWTLVPGIDGNISVTVIISDPNNSNIFYIGSGESFTQGDAVGRGIWKSTDAGITWTNIFGGYTGTSSGNNRIDGIFYVNDLVARDMGSTTELYAAIAGALYGPSLQTHGANEQGLYKSTDNGLNWTRFIINEINGTPSNPCDIELDIDNHIWLTTTRSRFGFDGGKIFESTNGTSFTLKHTIAGARRTELEPSSTNANKFWVAANVPSGSPLKNTADLFITTNSFTNVTPMNEPDDVDTDIPATDFTRGQAFYDLLIEADASDQLVVGGIDLFRTTNDGVAWSQISKWSNNNDLAALNVSRTYADQHAMVIRPGTGNGNKVVIGNDGGVFYSDNIVTAGGSTSAITSRNKDYNTVQFYSGTIDESGGANGDDMAGGAQDNSTLVTINANAGANSFTKEIGGDGGYTEIDESGQYMIASTPFNNHYFLNYPTSNTVYSISSGSGDSEAGDFINQAALDKNLNILYSNASTGGSFIIERTSNFISGSAGVVNTPLMNNIMNAEPTAFKVSPYTTASTTLIIGLENGRLIKLNTANSTADWLNIPNFNNPIGTFVGSISDIEFGIDDSQLFVTIHNYGVPSIWFSNNANTNMVTWRNIEGNLPDLPVKCILQNPLIPKELIIGTELGVWSTDDYTAISPSWAQSYTGMNDVTVVDLDVRATDNVILATTHGRGLFTSQFTSITLNIDENDLIDNNIRVYPTVSNGEITVVSKIALNGVNFDVYNLSGQKVYNSKIDLSSSPKQIRLNNVASGLYLIKITKDDFSETEKIIIR